MRISDWSSAVCSSDLAICIVATLLYPATPSAPHTSPAGPEVRATQSRPARLVGQRIEIRPPAYTGLDRKSVVSGKSVSVRVDLGGRRILQKKRQHTRS